jgi:hypothetical protein
MKVPNIQGLASRNDPKSCAGARNDSSKALTGERAGQVLSCEMQAPTVRGYNTGRGMQTGLLMSGSLNF